MLVGRSAECRRVDELLARTRARGGGALVVRGEAGIGKSSLLDHARAEADGMTVLSTAGVESESELAFASLLDLLRPLVAGRGEVLARLPAVQRAALGAALGFGRPVRAEPVVVYAATLGLLVAAAEEQPLLVLVDDAHWLDEPSAAALGFAARRLREDAVAVVVAERAEELSPFDPAGLPVMELRGLEPEDAQALLDQVAGRSISRRESAQLVELTA